MKIFEKLRSLVPEKSDAKKEAVLPAGPADVIIASVVVALVCFGVVMVYSASAVYAQVHFQNSTFFLFRQSVYAVLGIGVLFLAAGIDYHRYLPLTKPIFLVAFVLLVYVAAFGRSAGGATRWIALGPVNIQPAEVAKVAIIFWLAQSLAKKRDRVEDFSIGFLPHVLFAGLFMFLCMFQPDFGSAVMIGTMTFVLLFTAGAKLGYLLGSIVLAMPVALMLIVTSEYRMKRVMGFLGIGEHVAAATYQVDQSSYAFAQGGLTGVGIGDSVQKLLYLPEAHTDFISAIVGEELGLIGTLGLVAAYATLVVRAMRAAINAADDYGTYLAVGIGIFIGLQGFTNLGVAMGLLPTKGLVLPFMSYGGSSLLVNCAAVGVLLNVSRPREVPQTVIAPQEPESGRAIRTNSRGRRNVAVAGGAA